MRAPLLTTLTYAALCFGCGGDGGDSAEPCDTSGTSNCATEDTTTDTTSGPGVLEGDWGGTWQSVSGGGSTVTATFSHTGTDVAGTIDIANSSCFGTLQIDGTWNEDANALSFTADDGTVSLDVAVIVTGDLMGGTYAVTGSACDGDTGTLDLDRM